MALRLIRCTRCTMANTRPRSVVSQRQTTHGDPIEFHGGLCDGCRYFDLAKEIDWQARDRELDKLLDFYRSPSGLPDVVIPGSGGKDSHAVLHHLLKKGMHPVTVMWAPMMWTEIGVQNYRNWCRYAPNHLIQPPINTHRALCKEALINLGYPWQPFTAGQRIIGPKIAKSLGIDLVFYGEAPSIYGGPLEECFSPLMPKEFYTGPSEITLSGIPWDVLSVQYPRAHLEYYTPMAFSKSIECHYISYYRPWNPHEVYYEAQAMGFQAAEERTQGSYSRYSSIDDKFDPMHYWSTYLKFGIGRATYDSAHEVRNGIISREDGMNLVRAYDSEKPTTYWPEICEYLGLSPVEVDNILVQWSKTYIEEV